jgi:hypothetical protein
MDWDSASFGAVLKQLDGPHAVPGTIKKACAAVEECIASNKWVQICCRLLPVSTHKHQPSGAVQARLQHAFACSADGPLTRQPLPPSPRPPPPPYHRPTAVRRDNLRGFFEYCFPVLLKRVFGYDDVEASWLNAVTKAGREDDARSLMRLLSPQGAFEERGEGCFRPAACCTLPADASMARGDPCTVTSPNLAPTTHAPLNAPNQTGALSSAMRAADADRLIHFLFPPERLPAHTQEMLQSAGGRAELDRWPQYHGRLRADGGGRCQVRLFVVSKKGEHRYLPGRRRRLFPGVRTIPICVSCPPPTHRSLAPPSLPQKTKGHAQHVRVLHVLGGLLRPARHARRRRGQVRSLALPSPHTHAF